LLDLLVTRVGVGEAADRDLAGGLVDGEDDALVRDGMLGEFERAGGGLRDEPFAPEMAAGKAMLLRAYAWLERWLADNKLPPHVSIVTCAAAPSLFYADWTQPIPPDCPRLAALRAELLALPEVARCVDDARPFRPYFPPGAPARD